MSVARELELKLELTREEMQRVRGHPALGNLAVGEPVTRTLRSIYFDTPDYRLRALGISFRLRSDGDSWQQTVKSGTAVANALPKPIEAEGAVERPEPDLQVIGNRRIRRKVEKAVSRSILEPVFETVVQRTTRQLHSAEGDLELALDEGVVRAGSAENSLCEAELEFKSGSPACLLQTAAQLFAAAPVRLAKGSRAERGYSLALGKANRNGPSCRTSPPITPARRPSTSSCNPRPPRSPPIAWRCSRRTIRMPPTSCASACGGCAAPFLPFVP